MPRGATELISTNEANFIVQVSAAGRHGQKDYAAKQVQLEQLHGKLCRPSKCCLQQALRGEQRLDGRRPFDFRQIEWEVLQSLNADLCSCGMCPQHLLYPGMLLQLRVASLRVPNAAIGLMSLVSERLCFLQFATNDSGAEVLLGRTRVLTAISAELVPPFADRGNEGRVQYNVEFSPMASPAFEAGRPGAPLSAACSVPLNDALLAPQNSAVSHIYLRLPGLVQACCRRSSSGVLVAAAQRCVLPPRAGEAAQEVVRLVERALRDSHAVDLEALCVIAGRKVHAGICKPVPHTPSSLPGHENGRPCSSPPAANCAAHRMSDPPHPNMFTTRIWTSGPCASPRPQGARSSPNMLRGTACLHTSWLFGFLRPSGLHEIARVLARSGGRWPFHPE